MILTELQTYLAKYRQASLAELAAYLHSHPAAVRPMVELLVRKGRVRPITGKKCGGCTQCAPEANEFYEWIN